MLLPELVPELLPELVPELLPELVPELLPELVPELLPEFVPELLPELVPQLLVAGEGADTGVVVDTALQQALRFLLPDILRPLQPIPVRSRINTG